MQKPLSSSKLGPKLYGNDRSLKLCEHPIWNAMLQLRAVSKVVVWIFLNICLAKRSFIYIALFIEAGYDVL